MTYNEDPTRWTSSPEEAPELLRGAFSAGQNEGPNRTQMRSLALKLAAASAGGAVAIGTVKAASAGHAVATAATWSAGKITALVAIAGTLVTGGAVLWQSGSRPDGQAAARERSLRERTGAETTSATAPEPTERTVERAPTSTPTVEQAEALGAPTVEKLAPPSVQPLERALPTKAQLPAKRDSEPVSNAKVVNARGKSAPAPAHAKPAASKSKLANTALPASEDATRTSVKPNAPPSEVELLRRAQVALQGRPREAFQLTQEHRRFYPSGEFAQERDALAIQALMRAGDSDKARELAQSFIRAYPSSPHAHRFREAMGLH